MRAILIGFGVQAWAVTYRLSAYAMLNLIDDPALLAMAFC